MRGFTLVQALVGMAVVGVVAVVVLFLSGSVQSQGRDVHRIATINQAAAAIADYYGENHRYPVAADWNALCAMLGISAQDSDYHYAYGPRGSTKPSEFQVWVELEKSATALRATKNMNTKGWSGEGIDASSTQDLIYDQGVQ